MPITPSKSCPGQPNLLGLEPVAIISLSKESVSPFLNSSCFL